MPPTPTKTGPRTDEQLLADLRTISTRLGKPMSWKAYNAERDDEMLHSHAIMGRLKTTWAGACERAGVEPGAQTRPSYTRRNGEDALWAAVRDYLADDSRSGSYADFEQWCALDLARPGAGTVRNVLGRWSDIKERAVRDAAGDAL